MESLPSNSTGASKSASAKPGPQFNDAIRRARQAMQQKDWPEALRWWETARTIFPDHAAPYTGSGQALRAAGRLDEAEKLLCDAAERFPDHEQIAVALAAVTNLRRDWPASIPRWELVRRRFPDNLGAYVGSLAALRGGGRLSEAEKFLPAAEAALDAARQRNANIVGCLKLEFAIAKARLDWRRVQTCTKELLAHESPRSAQTLLSYAQACWHLGEAQAAEQAAQDALAVDPALTEAVIIVAWAAAERGDGEKTMQYYRRLAELNPQTPRWPLKIIELLNWHGRVVEAVSELDDVCKRWPKDQLVKAFLKIFGPGSALSRDLAEAGLSGNEDDNIGDDVFQALLSTAPAEARWRRPLVVASSQFDVQVQEIHGAGTAALVFTGAADGMSMPLSIFDRYLAALNMTTIYLKDYNRLVYLTGIRSLGADYDSTLTALRAMLSGLGARRLVTIGNCDGASAAIRYGIELGAERILSFGPSTHFTDRSLSKLDQKRNFRQKRLAHSVPPEMPDLKLFLETRTHTAQIEVFYKEEDERERANALRISDMPGISLHPVPGKIPHYIPQRLALATENFSEALGTWLGVGE